MGASLSEPVTKRVTESCCNENYKVASSSMQGWRLSMEDAHVQLLSTEEDEDLSFFGVYDGHGGADVARYASQYLHKRIVQSKLYQEGRVEEAIREGYLAIDEEIFHSDEAPGNMAGTTAVVVLIKDNVVYCGNVGDSRAVLSSAGWARPLSFDHKPVNELEIKRIMAAGGWVECNRVNGNLAMSRALGDFMYKRNQEKTVDEQIVTAVPEITSWHLSPQDEFIVIACDGIWDVLSNQEVVDFCRERIAVEKEPETICDDLLIKCLAPDCQMGGLGCDNMTVILVCLLEKKSYKVLAGKCGRPRLSASFCRQGAAESISTPSLFDTTLTSYKSVLISNVVSSSEGDVTTSVTVIDEQSCVGGEAADETTPLEARMTVPEVEKNTGSVEHQSAEQIISAKQTTECAPAETFETG